MGKYLTLALLLSCSAASAQVLTPLPMPPDNMPVLGVPSAKTITTQTIRQVPFDHPSWEPDEDTKKEALRQAYWRATHPAWPIDEEAKKRSIDEQGHAKPIELAPVNAKMVDPNEKNELDEQASRANLDRLQKKWVQFRNRIVASNICEEHHMHKVVTQGGKSWRCSK